MSYPSFNSTLNGNLKYLIKKNIIALVNQKLGRLMETSQPECVIQPGYYPNLYAEVGSTDFTHLVFIWNN